MDEIGKFIISRSTVAAISKLEIGQLAIGFAWRNDVWRKPHKLIQAISIEIIGAMMVFMLLMLPVDRLLNVDRSPPSASERFERLVWVDGTITIIIILGINRAIYLRGNRLQRSLDLVDKIDSYNQIVASIVALNRVTDIGNITDNAIEILSKTRHNLLAALEIDRYRRHYPHSSPLALTLDRHLIDLPPPEPNLELDVWGISMERVWEIGTSIYEETGNPKIH